MPLNSGPMGCILDKGYTLESDDRVFRSTGVSALWRESAAPFRGRWKALKERGVTAVLLWPAYESLAGTVLTPHHQQAGTCVSRGFEMAARLSYFNALASRIIVGKPAALPYEIIYAGSRNYPGKGQLTGDGSVGAWAAEWMSLYGLPVRGKYGNCDLTQGNESLAVSLGRRGARLDPAVLAAAKEHTWASHRLETTADFADAVASEFGVARCWDTLFGNRDGSGMSVASGTGAHCQAIIGVFVMPNGEDGFIEIQSWGLNSPSGPLTLKTISGTINLPAACYGVAAAQYQRAMSRSQWWEAHSVSIRPGQEYRSIL